MKLKPKSSSGIEGITKNGPSNSWRIRGKCTKTKAMMDFGCKPSIKEAKEELLRLEAEGKMAVRKGKYGTPYYYDNGEDVQIKAVAKTKAERLAAQDKKIVYLESLAESLRSKVSELEESLREAKELAKVNAEAAKQAAHEARMKAESQAHELRMLSDQLAAYATPEL